MFKRALLLFIFSALCSASIFAQSRIIISGRASIIIESKDNNTNIIAGTIETVSGGQFLTGDVLDVQADNSLYDGLPTEFVIENAYPNPFNPSTTIRYAIPEVKTLPRQSRDFQHATSLLIQIYDMAGRLVSDYRIGNKVPGWHEFTWQGTDSHGQQVSTGMYLITMRAGEHFQKQKVTFLK